jgi:hypothetical protein
LKAAIFDVINHQNALTHHHQQAEKQKQQLMAKLQEVLESKSKPAESKPAEGSEQS